ncbi:MAG: polysaccharide deacetylase [Ruminococcaceae bacterium]|nr:polysaccharide deacetylase [Oscillospiraceae bacterium]
MFCGKMKAVTFSYDDGVTQDFRLVELLNKYGLKATFNLNSELLGQKQSYCHGEVEVCHDKIQPEDVKSLYAGHEVAVHTLTHPRLPNITDDAEVIRQVEEDRLKLSELAGYEVIGMAYPCGGVNNDDRVAKLIRENTGVQYARTITANDSFEPQTNLYRFNPTLWHRDWDQMYELGEMFLGMKTDTPQIFYIWGHSYEFDIDDSWNLFADFCKFISGKEDIFYGTNREILL